MKKMSIPAYYRDKEGRESATVLLENKIREIMTIILRGETNQYLNKKVQSLFSIEFDPKFLDDTRFVVVSRYHVAITAMQIWQAKYATGKDCELIHSATTRSVENFICKTYIPYCQSLQKSILHKYSNHGALALMGECIAAKYMKHHCKNLNLRRQFKNDFPQFAKKLEKRASRAILTKKCWLGERGEFWVENLRNKKGLFYTHLHLGALLRTMVTISSEIMYPNDINPRKKLEDRTLEKLHSAYKTYVNYFYDPDSWPYMDRTKIPVLRQLQGLIFPADKFLAPRDGGKEGALMDVCTNKIYPLSSPPFQHNIVYQELGPFPFSTQIMESPYDLWSLL